MFNNIYKWVITIYCIYAPIAIWIVNENASREEFWPALFIWTITVPLIVGIVGYLIIRKKTSSVLSDDSKAIFVKTWSLLEFTKEFGPRLQLGEFSNTDTGKVFYRCIFTNKDDTKTYVDFMSYLGELSAKEISDRKEELKIGINKSGKYFLFDNNLKIWEDVKL